MLNNMIIYTTFRPPSFCLSGLLSFCLFFLPAPLYAVQITLNVADITAPSFAVHGIKVVLAQGGSAEFSIDKLHMAEKTWRKVHVHCTEFMLSSDRVTCRKGKLDAIPDMPFTFSYEFTVAIITIYVTIITNEVTYDTFT